jgi:cytochrome c oxidase cbb3-type subunit 4
MSAGVLSGLVTGVLLVAFVGGWIWLWRPRRQREFEAASRLPLEDNDSEPRA